jgi:D-sedoheptulose 7-phosphate isomerase
LNKLIIDRFKESILLKENVINDENIINLIEEISTSIVKALKKGNKIFFAGNGGSFADSIHLTGEFISRFMFNRKPLPAIALGANNSSLTAIGNDYSFKDIFSRELEALSKEGDVLIALSTSGNSENIVDVIKMAKAKRVVCYGLTGKSGGLMKKYCKCVQVQSDITARIQEIHIFIGHIICEIVEKSYFNK